METDDKSTEENLHWGNWALRRLNTIVTGVMALEVGALGSVSTVEIGQWGKWALV